MAAFRHDPGMQDEQDGGEDGPGQEEPERSERSRCLIGGYCAQVAKLVRDTDADAVLKLYPFCTFTRGATPPALIAQANVPNGTKISEGISRLARCPTRRHHSSSPVRTLSGLLR